MNRQKGFTLIELLVVIAIIGILSTLAVVSLNNARQKARDAKVISDVKSIQTALELYFSDQAQYPAAIASGTPIAFGSTTYMQKVPTLSATVDYGYYATNTPGTPTYSLIYKLEGSTGGINEGDHVATPASLNDDNNK